MKPVKEDRTEAVTLTKSASVRLENPLNLRERDRRKIKTKPHIHQNGQRKIQSLDHTKNPYVFEIRDGVSGHRFTCTIMATGAAEAEKRARHMFKNDFTLLRRIASLGAGQLKPTTNSFSLKEH